MDCPACTNVPLRRTRPKWFEWPLLAVLFWPWICRHCFGRVYRPVFWLPPMPRFRTRRRSSRRRTSHAR